MCAMAMVLAAPTLLCGQQQAATQTQKSAAPHSAPATVGQVVDGTYKNSSIGIEITPAPALQFESPQLSGTPGTVPFLVLIRATVIGLFTKLFSAKSEMYFLRGRSRLLPGDRRTAAAYIPRVIRVNEKAGWTVVSHGAPYPMGGNSYERANFVRGELSESGVDHDAQRLRLRLLFLRRKIRTAWIS